MDDGKQENYRKCSLQNWKSYFVGVGIKLFGGLKCIYIFEGFCQLALVRILHFAKYK